MINSSFHLWTRRRFVGAFAIGAGGLPLLTADALAEDLALTPPQTEGPFYPDKFPLDTDNDLLTINDGAATALGTVTYLSGRVLDIDGDPVRNATVEIWQCDQNGVYLHSRDSGAKKDKQDKAFQGFGRVLTGADGTYNFRTIRPVPYPGRAPHIHCKVWRGGKDALTTQCYIEGHELNARDGIYRRLGKEGQRLVTLPFQPLEESRIGSLRASWDLVLGRTPGD